MNSNVIFFLLVGSLLLIGAAGTWLTYQLKWKPLMKSLEKFLSDRKNSEKKD